MKRILIALLILISASGISCTQMDSHKEEKAVTQLPTDGKTNESKVKLEVKTYQNDSSIKGWGYDLYANGVLYIHQPTIPAVPGNSGFSTEQKAQTAGNFALYKIRNNIMPPTISVNELDSLGVLR